MLSRFPQLFQSFGMLKASRRLASEHQIEVIGTKLRSMMPWIKKNKLVDQEKN